jgi:hypothetical protein
MDVVVAARRRALVPFLALLSVQALAVTPKDRRFVSAKQGIGVEAPPGWTISTHTGYPSILVLLLHPDGSRISISASETPAKNARELIEINRKGLEAQKLAILKVTPGPREGVELEARAPARGETVSQLYLVRSIKPDTRQAIVISLVARTDVIASHRPALDLVIARLSLEPIETTAAATPARPKEAPAPPPASAGESAPEKESR